MNGIGGRIAWLAEQFAQTSESELLNLDSSQPGGRAGDLIVDIHEVVLNKKLPDKAKADLRRGWWLRKNPIQDPEHPYTIKEKNGLELNWCGMFATYVLIKAGFQVRWERTIVSLTPYELDHVYVDLRRKVPTIRIGDIAVRKGGRQHYMIIVGPPQLQSGGDPPKTFTTVEGNIGNPHPIRHASCIMDDIEELYQFVE